MKLQFSDLQQTAALFAFGVLRWPMGVWLFRPCLLYTSDAADE